MDSWRWIREINLGDILGSIQCPTLVQHRVGDRLVSVAEGRFMAEQIPGARMEELEGDAHSPMWGDTELQLAELGGVPHRPALGPQAL